MSKQWGSKGRESAKKDNKGSSTGRAHIRDQEIANIIKRGINDPKAIEKLLGELDPNALSKIRGQIRNQVNKNKQGK